MDQIIAGEIAVRGVIPFSRFMELALYCPKYGYYEKERDIVGRRGDFQTSVSVGSLFGELLAARFAGWLDDMKPAGATSRGLKPGAPGEFCGGPGACGGVPPGLSLVEAGAHHGDLALDILGWFEQERPDLLTELRYLIVEPSAVRRRVQSDRLARFGSTVAWCGTLEPGSIRGVIFSNELLDAMPVARVRWDSARREWCEMGVGSDAGKFVWGELPGAFSMPIPLPERLLDVLPDGFATEWSEPAGEWWGRAANALECGWLVTFDYGFEWEDFFDPCRASGTLRTYHRHRVGDTPLEKPGECDLTTHVNFSEVRRVGECAGLTTDYYGRQGAFLAEIAGRLPHGGEARSWTGQRMRQLRTLLHPVGFGDRFRVLAQRRV